MSVQDFAISMTIARAVVIAIGIVGNVISFIIFSRKTFRKNSISTYCQALAIFDSLTLAELANDIALLVYNITIADQSDALCKLMNYMPALYSAIPAWILVAFSLDKLFSMRTNSTMSLLKKKWFQWSLVSAIVLFNLLLYLIMPIRIRRTEFYPGGFYCDGSTLGFLNIYMIVFLLETCFIPFIIMIISSVLTIRSLIKSRNSIERAGHVNQERKSRDTKYAISSLTFNIMFITFKPPIMIFYILYSFYFSFDIYFYEFSFLFYFLNASSNIFVHMLTNSIFRREFLILVGLRKVNIEDMSNTTGKLNRVKGFTASSV